MRCKISFSDDTFSSLKQYFMNNPMKLSGKWSQVLTNWNWYQHTSPYELRHVQILFQSLCMLVDHLRVEMGFTGPIELKNTMACVSRLTKSLKATFWFIFKSGNFVLMSLYRNYIICLYLSRSGLSWLFCLFPTSLFTG